MQQYRKMQLELTLHLQGIGAAQDAARMQRVVSFYEALPRGPAPETKARGLFARYQARYFGKNPSAARMSFPQWIGMCLRPFG